MYYIVGDVKKYSQISTPMPGFNFSKSLPAEKKYVNSTLCAEVKEWSNSRKMVAAWIVFLAIALFVSGVLLLCGANNYASTFFFRATMLFLSLSAICIYVYDRRM